MLIIQIILVIFCFSGISEAQYGPENKILMDPRLYWILRERFPQLFDPEIVKRYNEVYSFGIGKRSGPSKISTNFDHALEQKPSVHNSPIEKRSIKTSENVVEALDKRKPFGVKPEEILRSLYGQGLLGTNWRSRLRYGKRPTSNFDFGIGKRNVQNAQYNVEEMSENPYSFGIGKKSANELYNVNLDSLENGLVAESDLYDMDPEFYFQAKSPFEYGLMKRGRGDYEFGLGKRPKEYYEFGLGKRGRGNYEFGLGKRGRGDYEFGLGKRGRGDYEFGLGKRGRGDYEFGLGKRGRGDYEFGLGKRGRGNYEFGLGKRGRGDYEFGLGKRGRGDYEFGLGKRARGNYEFGLGKRARGNYEFGLGKRYYGDSLLSYENGKSKVDKRSINNNKNTENIDENLTKMKTQHYSKEE